MFNGKNPNELNDFFSKCVPLILEDLNPLVLNELIQDQKEGYITVLLSGCLTNLLQGIGDALNMDYVIGTDIDYIKDQDKLKISHDLTVITGTKKVEKLIEIMNNKNIDWENSKAYADSSSDDCVLKLVGNPIAVNPDKELESIARENNWVIMLT